MNDTNLVSVLVAALSNRQETSQWLLALAPVLGAAATCLGAIAIYYAKKAAHIAEQTKQETTTLKEHINSRMTELQQETKKASFAEGADDARQRAKDLASVPPGTIVPALVLSDAQLAQIVKAISSARQSKSKDAV